MFWRCFRKVVAFFSRLNLLNGPYAVLTRSCYELARTPTEEGDYRAITLFVQWNKGLSTELNYLSLE